MMFGIHTLSIFYGLVFLQSSYCQNCHDIDTNACKLMVQQNPDLCTNEGLSFGACPRFCNKCPLQCYHCDVSVRDYKSCNAIKTCEPNEQCMLRELRSTVDSHNEFMMICASPQMCDESGLNVFGKRDVSTKCCTGDLCNYPVSSVISTATPIIPSTTPIVTSALPIVTTAMPSIAPVTPGCSRDITILVEDVSKRLTTETGAIVTFLKSLISNMQIGTNDNLVSLSLYDNDVHDRIHFTTTQTKAIILSQLDNLHFLHDDSRIDYSDLLHFLDSHLLNPRFDPRNTSKDVVVLLVDTYARPQQHHPNLGVTHFNGKDVIVVDIGSSPVMSIFNHLALDSHHVLTVQDYASLNNYVSELNSLICQ